MPETTVNIAFGFFVAGKGKAWADEFQFESVGKEVASTNMLTEVHPQEASETVRKKGDIPERAVNLDFES